MVGGSTRIPKIEFILFDFFENAKINNSINPDETVAYGATLMAAKILLKNTELTSGFNLMDISPFSLGTDIMNNSKDKDIQKEGKMMSVIIKRGSKIPIHNIETYFTTSDFQKSVSINVYEGEKKYVKYNHLLKEATLTGLEEKLAGKVKIKVKFEIDVNGILTVTGKEEEEDKDNKIEIKIKNDGIVLTEDEMKKIKEKNQKYMEKCKIKMNIDYNNIKVTLKQYQDTLKNIEDEEDKFDILMGCINFLEEFINKFDQDFDNETIIEKFYIYTKELFNSYTKVLKLTKFLDKGEQERIKSNIKKYLNFFIKLSSGYLDNLLEVLKDLPKKVFYEIIVFIMEKFNECGLNCLKEMKQFCRYNSLKYFEKTKNLFSKYIIDSNKLLFDIQIKNKCILQMRTCSEYIDDLNSYLILLCEDAIKFNKLISSGTGLSDKKKLLLDNNEGYQMILETYEKMLPQYEGKGDKREAIILANMIKIKLKLLGNVNYKMYYIMGKRCQFIVKDISPKPEWYTEFCKIFKELKEKCPSNIEEEIMKEKIKLKYKTQFENIDNIFNQKKDNIEFIDYILKNLPYKGYEEDKKNNKNFEKDSQELLSYLKAKYSPNEYTYNNQDEKSQLNYCLIEYIDQYLNRLYSNIN